GQIDILLQDFGPQFKSMLPGSEFDRFSYLLAAAAGNYDEAGKYLDELIRAAEKQAADFATRHFQAQLFQGSVTPSSMINMLGGVGEARRGLATYRTLRGMVALEQGDTTTAAKLFREALETSGGKATPDGGTFQFEGRAIALHYLPLLEQAGTK